MIKIITDIVVRGQGQGRRLGYPTANLAQRHSLASGVWTARVKILPSPLQGEGQGEVIGQSKIYPSLLVVGARRRPNHTLLEEVYLLGFRGNLYGKVLEIKVGKKLRAIKKFKNIAALKKQIKEDIELVISN